MDKFYVIIKGDNHFKLGTDYRIAEIDDDGRYIDILSGLDITEWANWALIDCDEFKTIKEAENYIENLNNNLEI